MECTNPPVGRLITRYELGALEPREQEAFVDHMIECLYCHDQVFSMTSVTATLRFRRHSALELKSANGLRNRYHLIPETVGGPVWLRRAFLAAALVILTIGSGLMVWYVGESVMSPGTVARLSDWEVPKPEYLARNDQRTFRGERESAIFGQAMAAYQAGDYARAAEGLEILCRLEPDHSEGLFYWGVSLLLSGRAVDAIEPLTRASEIQTHDERDRSRYYLALAYIKSGRMEAAASELDALISSGGAVKEKAQRLRQKLSISR